MYIVILIILAVGAVAFYKNFIKKPREKRLFYDQNPALLAIWQHKGKLKEMRKLKITSHVLGFPLEFKIGFTYLEGYLFYGIVKSRTDSAIVETFLGPGDCIFLFATVTPRKCTVELLPVNDSRKPDATFPPHWWQEL